jgi:hypothetical protein
LAMPLAFALNCTPRPITVAITHRPSLSPTVPMFPQSAYRAGVPLR